MSVYDIVLIILIIRAQCSADIASPAVICY